MTPLENRLCSTCKVVETEIRFLLEYPMHEVLGKVLSVDSYVKELLPVNKFIYPMTFSNEQILRWFTRLLIKGVS